MLPLGICPLCLRRRAQREVRAGRALPALLPPPSLLPASHTARVHGNGSGKVVKEEQQPQRMAHLTPSPACWVSISVGEM